MRTITRLTSTPVGSACLAGGRSLLPPLFGVTTYCPALLGPSPNDARCKKQIKAERVGPHQRKEGPKHTRTTEKLAGEVTQGPRQTANSTNLFLLQTFLLSSLSLVFFFFFVKNIVAAPSAGAVPRNLKKIIAWDRDTSTWSMMLLSHWLALNEYENEGLLTARRRCIMINTK